LKEALRGEKDTEALARMRSLIGKLDTHPGFFEEDETVRTKLDAMNQKISFEFVDTPLVDACAFLQSLLKIKVTAVEEGGAGTPVTIRVIDMKVSSALRWIARLSGSRMQIDGDGFVLAKCDQSGKVLKK